MLTNPDIALKAHIASYSGLWLVHSLTYPDGALLTSEAYRLFKRLAGPLELKSHTATFVPHLEPHHLDYEFVGSLEIRQAFSRPSV